ncbi:hypothetical protein [Streptomyces sp. TR02-1]|uniref:hypothetical protein n=1 Tax=Streptomyces sp. TR02-1 TaxID=3385977 RepID=UPI00399F6B1C
MRTLLRRTTATAVALGTLTAGAVTLAPTASAASCTKTTKTVDHPGYYGPWADNWTLTARMCSYRSGSYIYSQARLSWDGPSWLGDPSQIFDSAAFRVYLKKHNRDGKDPVRRYKTFWIQNRLEAGDGSYTTSWIGYPISKWARGDGAWKLGWNNDGRGWIHYGVKASPLV